MNSRFVRWSALLLVLAVLVACGRASTTEPAANRSAGGADTNGPAPVSDLAQVQEAVLVYSQPPRTSGGLLLSSWRAPDGSDTDRWLWENFGFENPQTISEIRWVGGYDPAAGGSGGPVQEFTITLYNSIEVGSEPDLSIHPLERFDIKGNASETPAQVLGGIQTYAYRYVLPVPYEFEAATTYWIQIQAFQAGDPDWGIAVGTGTLGDGRHFRASGNRMEGYYNQLALNDAAIEFWAPVIDGDVPIPEVATSLEDIAAMMADLPPAEEVPIGADGVQEIRLVVSRSGYTPVHFSVQRGVPVRLIFRQLGYVPGGNELNVRWGPNETTYVQLLSLTDSKQIEFTPPETGEYVYSCPHDWYWGVMTVLE